MTSSLYDVLTRRTPHAPGRGAGLVPSIIANLDRLFNSRRDGLAHLPDFGLPDVSQIYRDMPESIGGLTRAIQALVERYEPRLSRVRVEHQDTDPYAMQLEFLLSAELPDRSPVQFRTTFSSVEPVHVDPLA